MASLGLKHHWLDNKALATFKECIKANGMTHKLVPPGNHRRNLVERAIQIFKHHFIAILSRVGNKFPLSLWCHLLSPVELTINLLQQFNVAPKISSLCPRPWPTWLHEEAFCTTGLRSAGPCKTWCMTHVGCPFGGQFQHRNIHGTSLLFQIVHNKNKSHKNKQHGFL